jgi:hypothetical protein
LVTIAYARNFRTLGLSFWDTACLETQERHGVCLSVEAGWLPACLADQSRATACKEKYLPRLQAYLFQQKAAWAEPASPTHLLFPFLVRILEKEREYAAKDLQVTVELLLLIPAHNLSKKACANHSR